MMETKYYKINDRKYMVKETAAGHYKVTVKDDDTKYNYLFSNMKQVYQEMFSRAEIAADDFEE